MEHPHHVQLGLFSGCAEVVGMHTVAAHTRVLSDGTEVFVGEHLRWNPGRRTARTRPRRRGGGDPAPTQLPLWTDAPRADSRALDPEDPCSPCTASPPARR